MPLSVKEWLEKSRPREPFILRRDFPSDVFRRNEWESLEPKALEEYIRRIILVAAQNHANEAGWEQYSFAPVATIPGDTAWYITTDKGPITLVHECEREDWQLVALACVQPARPCPEIGAELRTEGNLPEEG